MRGFFRPALRNAPAAHRCFLGVLGHSEVSEVNVLR
jgi:hypothetical protein